MSSALVLPLIVALESNPGMSKWAFGIFTFVTLAALLVITLIFGKGRPHS